MYVFLAFVLLSAAFGVALLAAMRMRDDPILGVFGLMTLSASGMAAAAYGVLSSGA